MAKFPYTDLHSFKDYVGFVKLCAPSSFPPREGVHSSEQWSLDLAFVGLQEGLVMAEQEKGQRSVFGACRELFDAAYKAYRVGNIKDGFLHLGEAQKLLKSVPTQ